MLSLVVNVLSVTAVLVPLVVSVSLVFRVSGVVNFGTGGFCVFAGAGCASWSDSLGQVGGVALTLLSGAVLGAACYFIAILPAQSRGVRAIGLTLSTLGFGLLLTFLTRTVFGGEPSIVQPWIEGSVGLGGTEQVSRQRLLVIVLALVLLVLLWVLIDRTLVGRAMTAVAQDADLSSMYGLRRRRFELLTWTVSGVCLMVGGVFQATLASVSVDVAPTLLVYALAGAVVGGLGSLVGAVGGAVTAATAMRLTDELLSTGYHLTALFVLLSIVMVVRPQGLFTLRGSAERV